MAFAPSSATPENRGQLGRGGHLHDMRRSTRPPLLLLSVFGCMAEPELDDSDVDDDLGESSEDTSAEETAEQPDLGTPDLECELSELAYAPEPLILPDETLVPIDILQVDATLVFDAEAEQAHAEARVVFRTQTRGLPVFDLRQELGEVLLDGQPIDPTLVDTRRLGSDAFETMRILEVEVAPCVEHELELRYPLLKPSAPAVKPIDFVEGASAVRFEFDMADNEPGRYLEAWIPANLPWDRHSLFVDVQVEAEADHVVISNGDVIDEGEGSWSIEFPSSTTALSPLLMIRPTEGLLHESGVFVSAFGQAIPWDIHVYEALNTAPATYEFQIEQHLDTLIALNGPYPYDKLVVFGQLESMEYRGAVLTYSNDLRWKVFQSWWGRGLEPATCTDGWIDEAFAAYYVNPQSKPLPFATNPKPFYDPDPYARTMDPNSEESGRLVFAHLAYVMGHDMLIAAMRELSAQGLPRSLSTADLERHLHCVSGGLPEVRQTFHGFVRGLEGAPEPPPDDYCD